MQITGWLPKLSRVDILPIAFIQEDAQRLHHPHDDALVIIPLVADYTTRRVLMDNGSSVDILYYPTFQNMRINKEWLIPSDTPLVGFGETKVFHVGTITLAVIIGTYPQQLIRVITFLVVDYSLTYNAIIGRPTLNI